ncbi:MAG: ABC-F family ATP-binding cassette domain-containing protein [Bradymonadales bacterium]|nr:ABC-F family ATP-binding cassette domain-containing protein [Bradymonadales bacterium]
MSLMVQLDRVSKAYGGKTLFADLSWQLSAGQRIGLVGPNGAGKTTLFRLIHRTVEPDAGRVIIPKGMTVGLLPQEIDTLDDRPILEIVLEGRQELVELERRIGYLHRAIQEMNDLGRPHPGSLRAVIDDLVHELGQLQEQFEREGGYQLVANARQILSGMGFPPDRHQRPAGELSGGWRMRVLLSRLLLQRPEVLLLDEPTNHLDLPSLEWLESFLAGYEGTVVVVSHDRYFLNRLATQIASIEGGKLLVVQGNYDRFLETRQQQIEQLEKQYSAQQRLIAQNERFIERFRYKATKARQVQSRIKQLGKLERIEMPQTGQQALAIRFPAAPREGQTVMQLDQVTKRYGDLVVYSNLCFQLQRREHVALVGPNGGGKSTLLKLMAGAIRPDEGTVEPGHQVLVGYFAQHQVEALDPDKTVLEEMESWATHETFPLCRSILGGFLFSGEEVDKRISVLSGGERSRLALAKILLRPTNLLLLDEPTNHLDMVSRDAVLAAFHSYPGTIVLVSHDRRFINQLATRVVHVEGGRCVSYPGDYEYYHARRQMEARTAEEPQSRSGAKDESQPLEEVPNGNLTRKEQKRLEAERRNQLYRRTAGIKARLDSTEAIIQMTEEEVERLERELADPELYQDHSRARQVAESHAEARKELDELYSTWETLSRQIEEIQAELAEELVT